MRISEQVHATGTEPDIAAAQIDEAGADWAEQTRRVLTRDLLVRASVAGLAEGQALRFRALHLNLPLVVEVADRLGLTDAQRTRTEHAALEGLHEAVRLFDPYGEADFAVFAAAFVEWHTRTHLRGDDRAFTRRRRLALVPMISRRTGRPTRR